MLVHLSTISWYDGGKKGQEIKYFALLYVCIIKYKITNDRFILLLCIVKTHLKKILADMYEGCKYILIKGFRRVEKVQFFLKYYSLIRRFLHSKLNFEWKKNSNFYKWLFTKCFYVYLILCIARHCLYIYRYKKQRWK